MARGWRRRDIGRRLSWSDLRDFVKWLPPTGDSALWRARKPQSWWVTPEYVAIRNLQYVGELANWQRGGGKKAGAAPKPPKFPEDKEITVKSGDELLEKRRAQAEHLKRRRAQNKRAEVSSHGEG